MSFLILYELIQLAASKGIEFEREIVEAEYSFITDKIGQLQDKVSFHVSRSISTSSITHFQIVDIRIQCSAYASFCLMPIVYIVYYVFVQAVMDKSTSKHFMQL